MTPDPQPQTQAPSLQKQWRLALFWAMLGTLGALAVFPYALAINPSLAAKIPLPLELLVLMQAAQTGVMLLLLSWLGLRLGQAVGLDSPFARALVYRQPMAPLPKRTLAVAAMIGAVSALLIALLDKGFQPFMPPVTLPADFSVDLWKRLLASFYGGITEELLLRLGLMTLLVWVIWKAKTTFRGQGPATAPVFWTAIVLAAVLFGVGHLPAAAGIWPLTPLVVIRTVALNAVAGIAFGWLYWRRGLEHAMLAHFCADIVLHGLFGN